MCPTHNLLGCIKLVVATILDMLIERDILTIDDLRERAKELDLLDGVEDGMLHAKVDPDGTITPEARAEPTALDGLAEAAKQFEKDNE